MIGKVLEAHIKILATEGVCDVSEYEVDVLLNDGHVIKGVVSCEVADSLVLLETTAEIFVVYDEDIVRYSHVATDLTAF